MGVFPAPYEYIPSALSMVKAKKLTIHTNQEIFLSKTERKPHFDIYNNMNDKNNTIIHFEGVVMGRNFTEFYQKIREPIQQAGFDSSIVAVRFVKSFGPKMWHIVLDLAVGLKLTSS